MYFSFSWRLVHVLAILHDDTFFSSNQHTIMKSKSKKKIKIIYFILSLSYIPKREFNVDFGKKNRFCKIPTRDHNFWFLSHIWNHFQYNVSLRYIMMGELIVTCFDDCLFISLRRILMTRWWWWRDIINKSCRWWDDVSCIVTII